MRIAQVAPLYESVPPKLYGGTERVVSWLTEELVRLGHDVTLFASGDSSTSARLVPGSPQSLRLDPECRDQLAHHFVMLEQVFAEKDNFDLIHFHVDYLHFPMSRREQVVSLSTLHGRLDMPELIPIYRSYPLMPVVSISNAQRNPLPWLHWQDTVYHGMPENAFQMGAGRGQYLAFLGRISPEKGLDKAIEISRQSGIPLKIAAKIDRADQDYFESVIKPLLAAPHIEYIGEIGHREKNEFLGHATAFLFPIDWPEPFGIVMIEAMACGTPAIAYRRGSVAEVIQDGVTGYIVENEDAAVSALRGIENFDRLACRRSFEQRFTARRMADDYVTVYQRMLENSSESLTIANGALSWMKLAFPSSTT